MPATYTRSSTFSTIYVLAYPHSELAVRASRFLSRFHSRSVEPGRFALPLRSTLTAGSCATCFFRNSISTCVACCPPRLRDHLPRTGQTRVHPSCDGIPGHKDGGNAQLQ